MKVEKIDEDKPKVVLGSNLKLGKVYIHAAASGSKTPTLYQAIGYTVDKLYVCNLATGAVYTQQDSEAYVEVEAKVVWGLIK